MLSDVLPRGWQGAGALAEAEYAEWLPTWRAALLDRGLLVPSWPTEYGGSGRGLAEESILAEELARAGAPRFPLPTDATAAIGRARVVSAALLAAEQVGGLQAALDVAVSHAHTRVQFDRPIGGFQAVKHRLADMYVDLELSRWTAYFAVGTLAEGEPEDLGEADELAATTGAVVSEAFQRSTANLLQVLGGIGYTWEHPRICFSSGLPPPPGCWGPSTNGSMR